MTKTVADWLAKQKPDMKSAHKVISDVMGKPKKLKVKGKK